jgi:hypothetical protein
MDEGRRGGVGVACAVGASLLAWVLSACFGSSSGGAPDSGPSLDASTAADSSSPDAPAESAMDSSASASLDAAPDASPDAAPDGGGSNDAALCNSLTAAPVATCVFSQAVAPTEPRATLPPPADGTYVLTNATFYGSSQGAPIDCEMVLTISGTSMELFASGFNGQGGFSAGTSGQASYEIGWVTGGPWVNVTPTCPGAGGFDPLTSAAQHYDNGAAAQLGYLTTDGGLVLGMEAINPAVGGSGDGENPIVFTFTQQQ